MKWGDEERGSLGQRGEEAAARFLRKQGYKILEKNLRLGRNEVDILARQGDTLVFVEVRTRSQADAIAPEDTVGYTKQQHLRNAAQFYLAQHGDEESYYRFDVISVILPADGKPQITHYPDAFQ
jgi:putative endonuclease